MKTTDVIIVGAGLSGLACAREVAARGRTFVLLEADERPGGRVRSDTVDGFTLDRGFQVYLDAYPEGQRILDYDALQLRAFDPGAVVRVEAGGAARFTRVVDPWRQPSSALSSLVSPIGSLGDKLKVARLRRSVTRGTLEQLKSRPDDTTRQRLESLGFSRRMMDRFFVPFLSGIFLERELSTSSRFFEFVFRMFSLGRATLPADGMQAIPDQLASGLPAGSVRYGSAVESVRPGHVQLADGTRLDATSIVVAVDAPSAARLLGREHDHRIMNGVTCMYFAANEPPIRGRALVLDGTGVGPVNNLCVPTEVAAEYSSDNRALVSCSILGTEHADLESRVRAQMESWFGSDVRTWQRLATYEIPHALPRLEAGRTHTELVTKLGADTQPILVCGDHASEPSIQAAFLSGRAAADLACRTEART